MIWYTFNSSASSDGRTHRRRLRWLPGRYAGSCGTHVDDVIGICFVDDVAADLLAIRDICTSLLGPNAVADDKTELEVVGYTLCLDADRVDIAKKDFLKALHGFAQLM
jgi:hypothetical protein